MFSVIPVFFGKTRIAKGILALIVVAPAHAGGAGFSGSTAFAIARAVQKFNSAVVAAHSLVEPIPLQATDNVLFCDTFTNTSDPGGHVGPRQQAEQERDNKLAAEFERSEGLIIDPTATKYVNRVEQNIIRNSALPGCFTVKLIRDPEPNAYSLPGGFIYLTTGLVLLADTEGQLAAALAHETGHITARHSTTLHERSQLWGRLTLVGGPVGYAIRRSIGHLLAMKLLRNAEFEADILCLKYQRAAGYDPAEVSRLLQRALEDEESHGSFVERLADSHPLTATRIKRLEKAMRRLLPAKADYVVDTSDFHGIKARIAILADPDAVQSNTPK